MKIGYLRPLPTDPDSKKQLELLKQNKCDSIVQEKHSSAKRRVELDRLLKELKAGDKIVVASLYSLADSTSHLVEVISIVESKSAYFSSITEDIDTENSSGYTFSYILNHLAAFQRDATSANTKKGLLKARLKGSIAGRPRKPDANVRRAIEMYKSNEYSLSDINQETGISKSTLYRYLEK